ncbi:hypothetical protein [Arenimonas sp.]|uniref:hypothetical protein n=1 Tax=Arenimonas sp. TaxID=1872635 RepID=UPI0035B13861
MTLKIVLMAAGVFALAACSGGGGGSGGEPVTESECRQMFEKGAELQGIPGGVMDELIVAAAKECVESGKVTKEDYRCVMAATSPSESRACNVAM